LAEDRRQDNDESFSGFSYLYVEEFVDLWVGEFETETTNEDEWKNGHSD